MKIRTKLTLAVAILAAGLLAVGGSIVWRSASRAQELAQVQSLADFGLHVSSLIHETQKERGATAGFLGSRGKKFGNRLADQRLQTDEQLGRFQHFLHSFDIHACGTEFAAAVERGTKLLTSLAERRSGVDRLALTAPQAIGYYTAVNASLLDATGKASAATEVGEITTRLVAYNSFLKSKERAGIERAVLANTFAADRFAPGMYEKFTTIVALQDAYLGEFAASATPEDRAFFESTLAARCVGEVNAFRKTAVAASTTGGFGVDAGVWFDTITEKINLLKQVDDELAKRLKANAGNLAAQANAGFWWTLVLVSGVLGIGTITGFQTIRSTLRCLSQVTDRVRDIAEGEGDLTHRLETSNDELGELARWFNAFMDKLESTIGAIAQSAGSLQDNATALHGSAERLDTGASEAKQQVDSMTSQTEAMTSQIGQAAEATEQLSGSMKCVTESVGHIQHSIDDLARQSSSSSQLASVVGESVEKSNNRIAELSRVTEQIESVVALIEDVAEQTNLLALNATIEAARAGEAGKGFAVVATEVKDLAHQSAKATAGILECVKSMHSSTSETVEAIADIDRAFGAVTELIGSIDSAVSEQRENVHSISTALDESAGASAEVCSTLHALSEESRRVAEGARVVDGAVQETAAGAEQTNASGERVSNLADRLEQLTSQFVINS